MINSILLGAVPFVASQSRKNEPLEPTNQLGDCVIGDFIQKFYVSQPRILILKIFKIFLNFADTT